MARFLHLDNNVVLKRASDFGDMSRNSNFFTFSIDSRLRKGIQLGLGLDTGRTVEDKCLVVDSPQALLNCRIVTPYKGQTQIKLHGVYPLPAGFSVSGVLENLSGPSYGADYSASNNEIKGSLGRNLAACGTRVVCTSTVTVPLLAPQTQFDPRRTVLDLRLSKVFSVGNGKSVQATADIYNLFNSDGLLALNSSYGSLWRQGTGYSGGLIAARTVQVGGRLNF